MESCKNLAAILEELTFDAGLVSQEEVERVEGLILEARRVFVAGAGRSGFVARAFSNRLMHLGLDVHFVGDPTTPSIREGDLLIVGSGSGTTKGMVNDVKIAKREGAKIATVTISPEATIGSMADAHITIPGSSSRGGKRTAEKAPSIQPNGSSFEQLTWLVYDAMVVDLKRALDQSQDQMDYRHANME